MPVAVSDSSTLIHLAVLGRLVLSGSALRTPGVSPGVKALQPKAGPVFGFDFES